MAHKTSQLQIRVTEEQKAALKRLAAAAAVSVSEYVLTQALPTGHQKLDRMLVRLATPGADQAGLLADVASLVAESHPRDFPEVLGSPRLEGLSPLVRNHLAALVEQAANVHGIHPPGWVHGVPALARPHFVWPLSSLRAHQIRVTPVAFKRRGIFFDPASRPAYATPQPLPSGKSELPAEPLRRLNKLNDALSVPELKVEFYFLGGAVLSQVFHAKPATARIEAAFCPPAEAAEVAVDLARREGWPSGWVHQGVSELLGGGASARRYLELDHLAAFVPPLEYVLALAVARLRLGASGADDLRYVLRALNLTTADEALEVAGRYFTPRQLSSDVTATLRSLLAA